MAGTQRHSLAFASEGSRDGFSTRQRETFAVPHASQGGCVSTATTISARATLARLPSSVPSIPLAMSSSADVAALVQSLQALRETVEAQTSRIAALETTVASQGSELLVLRAEVARLDDGLVNVEAAALPGRTWVRAAAADRRRVRPSSSSYDVAEEV